MASPIIDVSGRVGRYNTESLSKKLTYHPSQAYPNHIKPPHVTLNALYVAYNMHK